MDLTNELTYYGHLVFGVSSLARFSIRCYLPLNLSPPPETQCVYPDDPRRRRAQERRN